MMNEYCPKCEEIMEERIGHITGEKYFFCKKCNTAREILPFINDPQPAPKSSTEPAAWSLVMRDMADRDVTGTAKYGTRLKPGDGRDSLIDAYQEGLDMVVYLRKAIYERDGR